MGKMGNRYNYYLNARCSVCNTAVKLYSGVKSGFCPYCGEEILFAESDFTNCALEPRERAVYANMLYEKAMKLAENNTSGNDIRCILIKAAVLGSTAAKLMLAQDLTNVKPQRAYGYAKSAADDGSDVGCLLVAKCYIEGIGVEVDYYKAREYLEKASALGNEYAKQALDILNGALDKAEKEAEEKRRIEYLASSSYSSPSFSSGEFSGYYDFRTGEKLIRNSNGDIVDSYGNPVSAAWWD